MRRRAFVGGIGGAAAWPLLARAQPAIPLIGLLSSSSLDTVTPALLKGMRVEGFEEGRNLALAKRAASGQFDKLPTLVAELVNLKVAVIFAHGGPLPAQAAKTATTTIPVVFGYGGDPVADGLVASFNRPGGNVTGVTFLGSALAAKRLELLKTLVPGVSDVAMMINPKSTNAKGQINDARTAAHALGQRLHVINAANASEIAEAFDTMDRLKVGALLVGTDVTYTRLFSDVIVTQAARHKMPAVYDLREYVAAGGLISYGTIPQEAWYQAGIYVGRILKGERPGNLPVVQPTKFETIINLSTAKALGACPRNGRPGG